MLRDHFTRLACRKRFRSENWFQVCAGNPAKTSEAEAVKVRKSSKIKSRSEKRSLKVKAKTNEAEKEKLVNVQDPSSEDTQMTNEQVTKSDESVLDILGKPSETAAEVKLLQEAAETSIISVSSV